MKIFIIIFSLFSLFSTFCYADISLTDLGIDDKAPQIEQKFSKAQFKERQHKLKNHEILGLTTLGLMAATTFTGNSALSSDMHMYLGFATAASYFTTAYFSWAAPKPVGMVDKGKVKWHKALAWIHLPAMLITPYLGYMYKKHEDDGKPHSSLERQHKTFAGILLGSYALAATIMIVEF
jgi:hypothetical protein